MFKVNEILTALSCINFSKIKNFTLLKISFYLSRIFKKPLLWAYPYAISIEPTTACNLACPACPSGLRQFTRPTGNMKSETFDLIFDQLKKYLLHINFYFQGEPLIHPKIFDWINTASKNKIFTMMSTNAHFLDQEKCHKIVQSGLHKMIISLDGISQKTYEQYRINGNVNKVLEGIQTLIKIKKELHSATPFITIQWIAFEHNMHELPQFIEYCKKNQLNYQIKTAQVYTNQDFKKFIPKNPKYSRYIHHDNEWKLKNKLNNHCWRMWASCVFTIDGSIVPCCFDKDAEYNMGNIHHESFKKIWQKNIYQGFRLNIFQNRKNIDICKNCSEGTKVWI